MKRKIYFDNSDPPNHGKKFHQHRMSLPIQEKEHKFTLGKALSAIEQNDVDYIKELLDSPGRLAMDQEGELLVAAIELDRRQIANQLLDSSVSVDSHNQDGSNCLMLAAASNNIELLERILEKRQLDVNATNLLGWSALMLAVYYDHPEAARALLLAGALADACDRDTMSCLNWAAGRGHLQCVSLLVQLGGAKVNQGDQHGTTPLIWASRRGHTEVASFLLQAGANLNSIGILGWSPLLVAVLGNHAETVRLLIQHKPNVNTCDSQRHTPLIAASKDGHVELVAMLLKARAFVNLTDDYGYSALIQASKGGHHEVVDILIKHHANLDHQGNDKKSALFWAVEKGNLLVAERLLQAKASPDLAAKDGETCLMKAVKLRDSNMVRLLIGHQARVSATDKDGDTALHIAARLQSLNMAQLILANPKNNQLLEKLNKNKQTPLMIDSLNKTRVFPDPLAQQNSQTTATTNNHPSAISIQAPQSISNRVLNALTNIFRLGLSIVTFSKSD